MTSSLASAFRLPPLFADLDEETVGQILSGAERRRFEPDQILFSEGESPEFLHVVTKGIVELFKDNAPRDCGLMLLTTGDLCMPAAAIFDELYLNSARSLGRSELLLLEVRNLREQFGRSHQLTINLSRVLAGQFRMAARHIIDLKCLSAAQRLAAFLLRLVDASSEGNDARLPVAKRHLATRVGMTPETFSRALPILAEHGLVVRGTRILIKDRASIENYIGSSVNSQGGETGFDVHVL